jgi:hypothetical protein
MRLSSIRPNGNRKDDASPSLGIRRCSAANVEIVSKYTIGIARLGHCVRRDRNPCSLWETRARATRSSFSRPRFTTLRVTSHQEDIGGHEDRQRSGADEGRSLQNEDVLRAQAGKVDPPGTDFSDRAPRERR